MHSKQALPDLIDKNLDTVFIGFNPGLRSAELGHHYAGRSNRFWRFLHQSGLLPVPLKAEEDYKLLDYGYGSTNIVDRPSRGAAELTREEYTEGREVLKAKLTHYRPKVACYVGIGVYQEFAIVRKIQPGLQPGSVVSGVLDYVISSPSGLNRTPYEEQLRLYCELRELLEQIKNTE